MNNMENEETEEQVSAEAGSTDNGVVGDGSGDAGEINNLDPSEYVPKSQYEELESKLGEQGSELGELRQIHKELTPLLEKLDENQPLVQAIMGGKIDQQLAESILNGQVSMEEAKEITQAHKEVKKDMGEQKYDKASQEEIERMIEEKVSSKISEVEKSLATEKTVREMERSLDNFIASTPDYAEYAEAIGEWFEDHRDQYDIEIAYQAVKGKALTEKASKDKKNSDKEEIKNSVANAGGGQSSSSQVISDRDDISEFVQIKGNPNVF